jgi:glycerophosphoryl diester phosphodiesterase
MILSGTGFSWWPSFTTIRHTCSNGISPIITGYQEQSPMTGICVLWLALAGPSAIPAGANKIEVTAGPQQTSLEVFTYKPAAYHDGPLIIVIHGILRNADEYRDHAKEMGDRLGALIAAPHFEKERFPTESFQQGGVLHDGHVRAKDDWTFSRVSEVANEIRRRESRPELPYYLLGHSAGGQFVERLAGFVDPGAARIVAANPGTHLFPTRDQRYPYGFGGLPEELSNDAALRRYLAQPLTLFLGTADTVVDEHLTVSPEANVQGAVRLERGRNMFEFARSLARERGWAFHWRLVEAEGIKHDHALMFNHPQEAAALFCLNPAQVVGHRGLLNEAPENTLANFRACLDLRIGFEFDVRRTRDGHLVCLHDETVDRTTDGEGKIADLTLEQVRKLDAGRWFSTDCTGEQVPTIEEVFSLVAGHRENDALLAVDIKTDDSRVEAGLVALASRHKVLDRLVFIGHTIDDPQVRRRLKQASAQARTARLVLNAGEFDAGLNDPDSDWLYVRFIPASRDVRRAQVAGKRMFLAGTLVAGREPAHWHSAAAAGLDAILTDHPLELRRQLLPRAPHEQKTGQ